MKIKLNKRLAKKNIILPIVHEKIKTNFESSAEKFLYCAQIYKIKELVLLINFSTNNLFINVYFMKEFQEAPTNILKLSSGSVDYKSNMLGRKARLKYDLIFSIITYFIELLVKSTYPFNLVIKGNAKKYLPKLRYTLLPYKKLITSIFIMRHKKHNGCRLAKKKRR